MLLSFATSLLLSRDTGEEESGLDPWFPWFSVEPSKGRQVSDWGPEATAELTGAASEVTIELQAAKP